MDKGSDQGADYFTKHHPTVHHRQVCIERKYVRDNLVDLKEKISFIFSKIEADTRDCEGVSMQVIPVTQILIQ